MTEKSTRTRTRGTIEARWVVECDGERELYSTRAAARAAARAWARHPANVDARRFGLYRNVTGQVRVRDCWRESSDET